MQDGERNLSEDWQQIDAIMECRAPEAYRAATDCLVTECGPLSKTPDWIGPTNWGRKAPTLGNSGNVYTPVPHVNEHQAEAITGNLKDLSITPKSKEKTRGVAGPDHGLQTPR